ncbi:MAG TPA: hypothetical protein VLB80_02095 [Candidatus Babeliales bacterium]|nr:hypothetical protein [Candidatus Babeliales bacterium]
MIYVLILISSLFSLHTILSTSFGSSTTKDFKQPINFFGQLITHQGQEYTVENISIQEKYKDIIMYDTPVQHGEAIINNDTKQLEIKLEQNPTTDFAKTTIKLEDVKQIEVPSPETIWIYQKKEHQQKHEYLELKITYQDKLKKSLLLERKTEIHCDEVTAESQKKIIPLSALKKLTIEGFVCRPETKNQSITCSPEKNNYKKSLQ